MYAADFPPRGSGREGRPETPPAETWGHPWELGPTWDWKPGMVMLGKWERRVLGRDDDRHVVTVAGSRAGKSSTVLIPNLRQYPGSVVVLDPKGELARATIEHRRRMGQKCFVLDPFGETGVPTAAHNPFAELGQGKREHIAADAAQLADALIIGNPKDPHWTDSAKNLIRGIVLHLLATNPKLATLREVRRLLNATPAELDRLFTAMVDSTAFDGIVANIGASFLGKKESGGRELQGIREREHGTIEHLLVMPVTPLEIMLSKVWSMGLVVLVASTLALVFIIKGWLGIPIAGSLVTFVVATALMLFATTSLGIFLATIAGSMPQLGLLLMLVLMPLQLLSGTMTPRESMRDIIQYVMLAAPNTHFVALAQAILFRGAGLAVVWPQLLALIVIGGILFTLALKQFSRFLR